MISSPPMKAKGVIVTVAVVVLALATHVSGRPQEVPEEATGENGKGEITFPNEFDLEQTEAGQTESSSTDGVTEADGTPAFETNTDQTDLTGGSEDEPGGTEVSETNLNGTDEPEVIPSETDLPETSPSEDELPEPEPSETETPEDSPVDTNVPEAGPSETDVPENTPSETNETETGPDQVNMTNIKPDMTEASPEETDISLPKPTETEAKPSEAASETSETHTEETKPSETETKPENTTSPTTSPDQSKSPTTNNSTDKTTSTTTPQTTTKTTAQTTRRPTAATRRPSLVGGSGGFPHPDARPGNLGVSRPERINETDDIQINRTTCRKPGVQYPIGITFDELRAALDEARVLLIDIRQPWELRETGRLPWSNNLPLPELEEAVQLSENAFMERYGFPKPMPEDDNVVLTCRSGRRVVRAWDLLEPYGYCNVRLYFGSYLDWKSRGGPLLPVPPARRP